MPLNQIAYCINKARIGVARILAGTTLNTNSDGSGTLTWVNDIKTGSPLTSTDKMQIRRIVISLTGNLATATVIRWFLSTVTTGNSSSNTWYIADKDLPVPVTTITTTGANTQIILDFDLGTFIIDALIYLCFALPTAIANGASVTVYADDFTA